MSLRKDCVRGREKEHKLIHTKINNKHVLGKPSVLLAWIPLHFVYYIFYPWSTFQVNLTTCIGRLLWMFTQLSSAVCLHLLVSLILQNLYGRKILL